MVQKILHALLAFAFVLPGRGAAQQVSDFEYPSCPCLTNLTDFAIDPSEDLEGLYEELGTDLNTSTYGVGCGLHDLHSPQCTGSKCNDTLANCGTSWCERSWCWVDPTNCKLLNRRSDYFSKSGRFYSYATCGDMDAFTREKRLSSLTGVALKVAFNHNSGGWLGAYSSEKVDFEGPIEKWSGPVVNFVKQAANRSGFKLSLTAPPEFLRNSSNEFFGSHSSFDFCVYATSLGYLDMCVAQYTVTDQRASSTEFLLLDSTGVYLVVQTASAESKNGWAEFMESVTVIFQPFTPGTWLFILAFVIPVFGILMVYHEYGQSGSTFPSEEKVIVVNEDGTQDLKVFHVPLYRSIVKSVYTVTLSVFQSTYEQSVTTIGALLNLLGVSFFILTIIAAYTANLAALLTQKAQKTSVSNMDDAIRSGYRFCAERKNMEAIVSVYSNVKPSMFVTDPIELGGDGQPGFNCGSCSSRTLVFDMLDPDIAQSGDFSYCHAAIAPQEDLDVLQADGAHCNRAIVGTPIQYSQTGFPIFEKISPQLVSFFLRLKNEGIMDREILRSRPASQCPVELGEGSALTLSQLTGIWMVSFGFAFAGLCVAFCLPFSRRKSKARSKRVHKRDQNGVVLETFEMCENLEINLEMGGEQVTERTRLKSAELVGDDTHSNSVTDRGGDDTHSNSVTDGGSS
jgi:hypothetical protein